MYGAWLRGEKKMLDRVTKTLLGREWCDGESPPETPAETRTAIYSLAARRAVKYSYYRARTATQNLVSLELLRGQRVRWLREWLTAVHNE